MIVFRITSVPSHPPNHDLPVFIEKRRKEEKKKEKKSSSVLINGGGQLGPIFQLRPLSPPHSVPPLPPLLFHILFFFCFFFPSLPLGDYNKIKTT